jgi:hypothetical protein
MSVWHNQDMGGAYWVDVAKGRRLLITKDDGAFDFARNNFAEQARVAHFGFSSEA